MKKINFECGCSFDTNEHGKIIFNPDINTLNLDCPATWDLICDGNTKGVFQLESQLGQSKSKEVKPRNMEELSDLIAIIRPGTMDSFINGKSLTKHYIDRKHGREEVEYLDESLIPILKPTQGILVFQEQALQIAKDIAGFTMAEAELLRKAIGKKKVELMKQIKTEFIDKCESKGVVTKSVAEEIFKWIEASQRYSFNKSILDDTKVSTPSGYKQIKDLNIGDYVLSPTKNNNNNEFKDQYVKVLNKYDHGEQQVFKITLDNGNEITCTMEHKFLCSDGRIHPLSEILLQDLQIMCME